ncbi:hypothetical protein TRIATDRAFT_214875 [Trichoderma atroviride IMI 206040]|uniref:Uncharacterized protein n=1 Tax=Hypocrea atroviridis (strain ATCC 20476 / IMI 206040) TaxID=452589 RepID=G9NLB8_HYPAI|nr:uncharacterized protein TRIATDRAFT_214875 [Trichoderma atroviride IMI 206040]EHK48682.1 hypothetical protein TRIATDRAFT_214875 [Trichoderma atroviride IMI 206040]
MKWIVTRYPKPSGQLIALGAILSDPEDPETRLNWHSTTDIDPKYLIDESTAVQRVIHAGISNDDHIMLKLTQLLGGGLNASGGAKDDRKTTIDAVDVEAKTFLPDKKYMNACMETPEVQEYVKKCNFSKTLYMIIGVASANKLRIREESSKQRSAGVGVTASYPGGLDLGTVGGCHKNTQTTVSEMGTEQKCDFAYRIREFTYWKYRREKVKMKADRNAGALFRTGNTENDEGYDDSDDSDNDAYENVALFNELKEVDVSRSNETVFYFET